MTELWVMMSVWLPQQLLHQHNIQAGGVVTDWCWGILAQGARPEKNRTAERWLSIRMMVGQLFPPDARLHRAAVHVGTSTIPLGFFCFLWSTRFKVYSVCGWLSRSSMSSLVMHSRNVFFSNNRVDVFSLSVNVSLFFFQASMESSMHWIKMTFWGKKCLMQGYVYVQQGLLGA